LLQANKIQNDISNKKLEKVLIVGGVVYN